MRAEQSTRRRWAILALTCVGAFMAPLDGSIVAVALPSMGPDLRLSFGASMWIQASYLLAMAVLLIPLGRMADRRGRMSFYLGGTALFMAGSLAAALSHHGWSLILSRVVQGAGGALLSATSAALVTEVFPPAERGRALGLNVMAVYAGLSAGPPLGGFLVQNFGWPSIFLINLPIGMAVLGWGAWLFEHQPRPGGSARLDLPGTALLGSTLLCLILPLTFGSQWGWSSRPVWGLLLGSVLFGTWFVRVEREASDPLLDLALLRENRLFARANLAALLNYMALYAVAILTAVHVQLVQGRSVREAGWIMLCQPLLQACLSPVAGRLSDRLGSRALSTAGMLVIALGMAMLAGMGPGVGLPRLLGALGLVGIGMAAFSAPNTSAIMGSVDRSRLGIASAFLGTMRVVGQVLSVAILGGIASGRLGAEGWHHLLMDQRKGASAADFAQGYSWAMGAGLALCLVGAWISSTRNPHRVAASELQ